MRRAWASGSGGIAEHAGGGTPLASSTISSFCPSGSLKRSRATALLDAFRGNSCS
jgi:hypothetical protein